MTRINGAATSAPFPRTNQAFLRAIAGDDWRRVHVTGFAGDPDAPPPGAWSGGPAGTWPWETTDNNYFTVSLFHGPRRLAQTLERWLVLGVDDVGTPKVKAADVLSILGEPSFKIETSPGNEQWGYILGGAPITDAAWANEFIKALIRALVGEDGKDPGMRDVTRYFRLPIGHNQKAHLCVPGVFGLGFTVRVTHWDRNLTLQLTDAVCARLGVSPVSPETCPGTNVTVSVPTRSNLVSSSSQAIDQLAEHDLLFQAMRRLGLVTGGPRNSAMGRAYDVICPWVHEHTGRATTGAAYVPILQRFQCHHGHCQDRTGEDLQARIDEMLREDSGGLTRAIDIEFDVVDPATVELPDNLKRWDGEFFARYVWLGPKDGFWDVDRQVLVHDRTLNSAWTHQLGKLLPWVGEGKRRHPMPPAVWFLRDRRGRHVDGLIYWPGQPDIVSHDGQTLVNRWRPLARPLRGVTVGDPDVQPWLDLYWHVIDGKTVEAWELGEMILDWLAMVLASNVKGGWQVLVIGAQGIGKDMIVAPLMRALGTRMAQVLSASEVASQWTEWMSRRLVLFSEIRQTTRGTTSPHDQMARLKSAFDPGKEWLPINPKTAPHATAWNVVMGWLTSNEEAPLRLEEGDRRFLVLDRRCVVRWPDAAYARLGRWLEYENGFARVAEWLFHRWETMPDARKRTLVGVAPMTEAKAVMIEENEDPIDAWLRDCVESEYPDPEALPDVVSVEFVIQRLLQAQHTGRFNVRVNANAKSVGRRLERAGAVKLNDGVQVRVEGRRVRAWAVRNTALYLPLNPADIAKVCNVIGLTAQSLKLN